MNIHISKRDAKKVVDILRAYVTNCELEDINFFGPDHSPYTKQYETILQYASKIEKQLPAKSTSK